VVFRHPAAEIARDVKRDRRRWPYDDHVKAETRTFYEVAVMAAIDRIVGGLDRALDLTELARGASLSPLHFHHVFRGMVGETPLELHRRLRLERAAWQLRRGDAAVTTIAFGAGYESHESFTRAFRDAYAVSPTEFRRDAGAAATGCARSRPTILAARSGLHFDERPGAALRVVFTKGESIMQVQLENMPELRAAAVAHVGPYNTISEAFGRLGAIAGRAGLFAKPGAAMIAIYHDDPESTPPAELHSDAAITVPRDAPLPEGVREIRIPAGRYAHTTHKGPYAGLGDSWARFMGEWLPKSGHRAKEGMSFEIYRNTPADVGPEALVTELYLPIE
jgi:AraC family transcriptional regulator